MRSDVPQTRYATAPDGSRVAYQVVGDGPGDVALVTDWVSAVDLMWELPPIERFLRELASVGRLILFDKRANGASDGAPLEPGRIGPMVEHSADDLLAVLDAAGSDRADVVANSFGGWPATLFAATHPDRCGRLVLQDCTPRFVQAEDYDHGIDAETLAGAVESIRAVWGRGLSLAVGAPDWLEDEELRRAYGRYERLAVERAWLADAWRLIAEFDLRGVLPLVRAETLVIAHPEANPLTGGGAVGALLAEQIPGARYLTLGGTSTLYWADRRVADEIVRFLAGDARRAPDEDRILATVLFTDLVDSTARVAELGDRRWRAVLESHDRVTAEILQRFRGRLIKRTGDGLLALFDGPGRAVRCAEAICGEVRELGVDVRAGVHVGEVELRGGDVGGIAVHIASRVMHLAGAGEVVVSRTVKDLTAGSGLVFAERGTQRLKGIDEPWETFLVQ